LKKTQKNAKVLPLGIMLNVLMKDT